MDFSFSFLLFFWWEELRDFVLVNFFFFLNDERENASLAHSKHSHKILFGHD